MFAASVLPPIVETTAVRGGGEEQHAQGEPMDVGAVCSPGGSCCSSGAAKSPTPRAEDREWDESSEYYIRHIRTVALRNAQRCRDTALWSRKMHTRLALPTVVIPIVM